MKTCTHCKQTKPLEAYQQKKDRSKPRLRSECRSCRAKLQSSKNPKVKARQLLKLYNLQYADFLKMQEEQNNSCKICKTPADLTTQKALVVDHCHATQKVRALLCHNCNLAIGVVKENIPTLESAIEYLREHSRGC